MQWIEADPEKLQAIADLSLRGNVQEVRTFLSSLAKTTADYGSAGGRSCLQTDQSVLLLGMAWKVFIKGRDGIVVVKLVWTVSGAEHTAQRIQDRNPLLPRVLGHCLRSMEGTKESLSVVSGPKALFGGQGSTETSKIWCNNAEFALYKGKTSPNRLSRHPYQTVPGKS